MGLPSINIVFLSKAIAAITRGAVGTLALVLKDASVSGTNVVDNKIYLSTDIPAGLSAANKAIIEQALLGTPKEIRAIVISSSAADYTKALAYLETIKFNVMTVPGIASGDVATISTWVKGMRDTKERKIIGVLPNIVADHEGVVNFATATVNVGVTTYTTENYLARMAGLIAGLPLTVAPTFQVLGEVTDCPHLTKADADTAVDAGKFILYHDGEKVKIARGVTSLTTTTETKGSDWKKIKIVRILDMLFTDIKETMEDVYIGKYQNSYINKLLLIQAIKAYLEKLELERVLDAGWSVDIDVPAQKTYLCSIGEPVDTMTEQEIREANTRDQVFLTSKVRPLDAIEQIDLVVNL